MTRTGTTRDSYTGRAGQLAVLAELLVRGVNAAVPEVDEGEDILAFVVGNPTVIRIQVKTATAERLQEEGRYAARISVPFRHLAPPVEDATYFVFAIRLEPYWVDFVILSVKELDTEYRTHGVGYTNQTAKELQLYLSFNSQTLRCSSRDWQPYRNDWDRLLRSPPRS